MYEFLEGRVAGRRATRLVLDVHGVGYDLAVPLFASFPAPGAAAKVWIHQVVRADEHLLYGFPDLPGRDLFRLLLGVRGVGPASALSLVSSLERADLVHAIVHDDAKPLCSVRGIGKRTADQILLDLRGKRDELTATLGTAEDLRQVELSPKAAERQLQDQAAAALVSIGFSEKEAKKAVAAAARSVKTDDIEVLVRSALQG